MTGSLDKTCSFVSPGADLLFCGSMGGGDDGGGGGGGAGGACWAGVHL